MQQAVERALDRADYVIASAQQRPPKRKRSSSGEASLYEKLYDIYVEECGKEPEATEELRSNVNLLEKLVRRESLPCLVINLYPGEGGYSLMLEGKHGEYSETIRLPYEEGELLDYLDAEELPPALLDLLEKSQVNFFHCGCVIAQVRDYRQCSGGEPPGYQSRHILLRPTMQTLACDVQSITSDGQEWTQEDKLLLESQLILATAEPLCLDPSIAVACTANRLLYDKQKMNTRPMKRSLKRYSAPFLNPQQELSHCPPPPEPRVLTSCKKSKESEASDNSNFIISNAANYVDMWKQRPCDLTVPSEVDVQQYANWENLVKYDDSQPRVWPAHEVKDDFVFGYEDVDESQTTKLTLRRSLNDPLISGERRRRKKVRYERQMSPLHPSTDDHSNSVLPGSKADAGMAVTQSEVLVQKKARCPGTMSHSSSDSASLSQLPPEKETEQPKIELVQSSVLVKGVRHPSPTIKPSSSSEKTSSGNSFTPWQRSSFLKSPSPVLASKPPHLSQKPTKSSVEVNRVNMLPVASLNTTSSSQRSLTTPVMASSAGHNSIKVVGPGCGAQALGRGSSLRKGSTSGTTAPMGIKPSNLSSVAPPPNAVPIAPQTPQTEVQFILQNASSISPVTLLELPQGSLLLNTQQQPQQQWLYQLTPQPQLQQPTTTSQQPPTTGPQEPVPLGSSAQGSTNQRIASSAQQTIVLNLPGAESFLQPQAVVLAPHASTESQIRPQQSHPGHPLQPAWALQLQAQQQIQQLRILQGPVTVTTVAAQTTRPPPLSERRANRSKGKTKRSTSTTRKS
ncbi:transcription factor SPT20 homolog [Ailuropoda melanoleuca]|uniref:transcription factor SPT20 homolog n=1 Tax=Ailuropoda melanoleuca TaxID=9646 RepID=UPI001494ED7E|nr:transcription factor SPT20 homolog [Ailuropoda melanoleuca]